MFRWRCELGSQHSYWHVPNRVSLVADACSSRRTENHRRDHCATDDHDWMFSHVVGEYAAWEHRLSWTLLLMRMLLCSILLLKQQWLNQLLHLLECIFERIIPVYRENQVERERHSKCPSVITYMRVFGVFVTTTACPFLSTLWSRPKKAATRWTIIRSSMSERESHLDLLGREKEQRSRHTWVHCLKLMRCLLVGLDELSKNCFEC